MTNLHLYTLVVPLCLFATNFNPQMLEARASNIWERVLFFSQNSVGWQNGYQKY